MKSRFVQYIEERQSTFASGLAALLIIVAGFLVFSYFSGLNKTKAPAVTSTSTQSAQVAQTASPSAPIASNKTNLQSQAKSPSPAPQVASANTKAATYTVVRGDSLAAIAVKFYQDANKWTLIASANKLANPSVIHAGNILTIPSVSAQPTVAAATPQPSAASATKINTTYTVKAGDTLWSIAEQFYGSGFEWYRIDQANGTLPRNAAGKPIISAGQSLKIP